MPIQGYRVTVEHCALDREWRYCLYGPEGLGSGGLAETRWGESGSMVVVHEYIMQEMTLASKSIKISRYTRMPTVFLWLFGLRYGNNKVCVFFETVRQG